MSRATDHLTSAQIEDYVTQDFREAAPAQHQGLEAHLQECESCLARLLHAHRMHLGLLEGDRMRKNPYPGCPDETTLQELAAGISPPELAEQTTQHAAQCDFCGPLLNRYVKEFSDELEAEDAAILKQLESSKPKWQKKFVRQNIVSDSGSESFFGRFWPRLATAAAAAAIAFGVFLWLRPPDDLSHAQKLVASAYAERRTTEMRLPAAAYGRFAPIPVVKGSSDAGDWNSQPAPLLEAENVVRQKTSGGNLSPSWLQVRGRIDLLEGSQRGIDQAIESFEKALAIDAQNPALKVDLATALFEKEMRADHDRPVLARSIDLLTDVTKNSSTDEKLRAAALFDLALAYEKSEMRDLAISAWNNYLQLDKTSEWHKEAQQHLDDLRNHAPPPRQQGYTQPSYFLAHSSDPDVLADLEEYQDIAVRTWLPTAIENPTSESGRAAAELARLLTKYHFDPWLQDFLNHTTPSDLPATKKLAAAFTYDLNDLHYQAVRESQSAAVLFRIQHNFAGELRALYQEVYGLQRSLAADDCIDRINKVWPRVFATNYHWLQGQLALEKSSCSNLNLDFPAASLNVNTSRQIAREFQFPELRLRVAGFEAGIQRWQENYDAAWTEAVRGLRTYWLGQCAAGGIETSDSDFTAHPCPYSWERLYQFYSVMQQCARRMGLPRASEALLLQGIAILQNNAPDDISLKSMLYLRLANTLSRQDEEDLAKSMAVRAESLLKQIPTHEPTGQVYAAMTRIDLAEFELNRGDAKSALLKIEPVRELLPGQDDLVRLDFYTTEGDVYRQLNRLDDAVSAYNLGIQVTESAPQDNSNQMNWVLATGKAYRGLVHALLQMGQTREALSVWEWFLRRSLKTAISGKAAPASPYLPLPSVPVPHLVYASFQDGLQVWIVRGSNIASRWVSVNWEDLQHEVAEFKKQCANPSAALNKAQILYSWLLKPVLADLPASGVIAVELDEPLWGLTFAALRNEDGHYLAEEHPIVYSPGILAEATLRQPASVRMEDSMLLVDASQSADGIPLPGHLEEVHAVTHAFGRTTVLGPLRITPEAVGRALERSTEFHFSGHGKPDATGTALVIGSDIFLRAKDFSPQRLKRLDLAVLSACSSGSAKNWVFDPGNLVRSFLSGGVPNVIASGWEVDSRSTAHFMQSFYGQLQTGKTAAEALQYAQAEMRSTNSHPYYWAAFSLTGRVN